MTQTHTSKRPRPLSHTSSRFQEGSMNDRTSAIPPVHFLGSRNQVLPEKATSTDSVRPLSKEWSVRPEPTILHKKSSKFLGQMWDGVRGKLRLRREPEEDKPKKSSDNRNSQSPEVEQVENKADQRPTREEVLANYHQLVETGFFTSHAIQSTRQPAPHGFAPSHPQNRPGNNRLAVPHIESDKPPSHRVPRRKPLPAPPQSRPDLENDAVMGGMPSMFPQQPPVTRSSRGTKRAASDDDEDDHLSASKGNENDLATTCGRTPPRKLRKSASRDVVPPRLRKVASRRNLLPRRSVSASIPNIADPAICPPATRESSRLAKRVPHRFPAQGPINIAEDDPVAVSGSNHANRHQPQRVLRPRRSAAEPLSVVANCNGGVPTVPAIPTKFTYGIDRENDGPWRGLRVRPAR